MRSVVDRNVVLRRMTVLMRREFVDCKENGSQSVTKVLEKWVNR